MNRFFFVHDTACVDEGAQIGNDSKIWHFCHVMPKAVIGERCSLGQNVFVANHVSIGNGVKIQNNVSVYEGVTLENDVFCGPSMVFTNDLNPRAALPKGANNYTKTHVKQGCSIGANATIVCGTTLGAYSFIGAGAVVTRNVADFAVCRGVPARQKGWICVCGMFLEFQSQQTQCSSCQRCFTQKNDHTIVLEEDLS